MTTMHHGKEVVRHRASGMGMFLGYFLLINREMMCYHQMGLFRFWDAVSLCNLSSDSNPSSVPYIHEASQSNVVRQVWVKFCGH